MTDVAERRRFIEYWRTLWMSGAEQLLARGAVTPQLVEMMQAEFSTLAQNHSSTYHYSARQLHARR